MLLGEQQTELAAQLQSALNSRAIIEQAKGVLIGRQGLTARDAYDQLRAGEGRTPQARDRLGRSGARRHPGGRRKLTALADRFAADGFTASPRRPETRGCPYAGACYRASGIGSFP
jgi:hypothetical protein